MQFTCLVDQQEALRRGIDAPTSTVKINIDPADLTIEQRNLVALILKDGYDLTHQAVVPIYAPIKPPEDVSLPLFAPDNEESEQVWVSIRVTHPSREGFLEAVRDTVRSLWPKQVQAMQQKVERRRKADEALTRIIEEGCPQAHVIVSLDRNGELIENQQVAQVSVSREGIKMPVCDVSYQSNHMASDIRHASPEVIERYRQRFKEISSLRDKIRKHVAADMKKTEYQTWLEDQRRERAEFESLYKQLPKTLRQRHGDGYADHSEILQVISELILDDTGLEEAMMGEQKRMDPGDEALPLSYLGKAKRLTDSQYQGYQSLRNALPDDATINPEQWEVLGDESGEILVLAEVTIKRGGVPGTVHYKL